MFGIEKLGVKYGNTTAVEDVSFDIHHNNITALIGPPVAARAP